MGNTGHCAHQQPLEHVNVSRVDLWCQDGTGFGRCASKQQHHRPAERPACLCGHAASTCPVTCSAAYYTLCLSIHLPDRRYPTRPQQRKHQVCDLASGESGATQSNGAEGTGQHRKRWSVGFSSCASTSAHSGTRVCSSARPSSPAAVALRVHASKHNRICCAACFVHSLSQHGRPCIMAV